MSSGANNREGAHSFEHSEDVAAVQMRPLPNFIDPPLPPGSRPVGIAVARIAYGFHMGILYKVENAPRRFLHLTDHLELMDVVEPLRYYKEAEIPHIDPDDLDTIASFCSELSAFPKAFPYGPHYIRGGIQRVAGPFRAPTPACGLTCSTFVMDVLATFGVILVDETNWPKRASDVEILNASVNILTKAKADPGYIRAVKEKELEHRFQATEVAVAAGAYDGSPMPFLEAETLGAALAAQL